MNHFKNTPRFAARDDGVGPSPDGGASVFWSGRPANILDFREALANADYELALEQAAQISEECGMALIREGMEPWRNRTDRVCEIALESEAARTRRFRDRIRYGWILAAVAAPLIATAKHFGFSSWQFVAVLGAEILLSVYAVVRVGGEADDAMGTALREYSRGWE